MKSKSTLVALSLLASVSMAHAAQGVTSDKITVGSLQDLSGPIAGFGTQIRFGMTLRMQEINEQGGINGRMLDIKFEDTQYDPKKAVLGAQKLVNQDMIFAMLGSLGTATNMAMTPIMTLPVKIVSRSKRSRRGNQPGALLESRRMPKSQPIDRKKSMVPRAKTNKISALTMIVTSADPPNNRRMRRS